MEVHDHGRLKPPLEMALDRITRRIARLEEAREKLVALIEKRNNSDSVRKDPTGDGESTGRGGAKLREDVPIFKNDRNIPGTKE